MRRQNPRAEEIAAMKIDEANIDDIPQLCGLLGSLFAQEAYFTPDASRQAAGLRQIIGSPEAGRIIVLRDGPVIVGMVNLLFTFSTALGGRVALLEDMIIRESCRGMGAGSNLLRSAIAVARIYGCLRITLLTDKTNSVAQKFYARHGFGPSAMLPMRLLLEE